MSEIIVQGLQKKFGEEIAVDDISFTVKEREFVSLLGPSGCGKTTTLRCIAGLEAPDSGTILIDGIPLTSISQRIFVPPEKRNLGMVFQSYAVWPHMTVGENVAYGLRARRISGATAANRVQESLRLVGLEGLENRNVTKLSGGQQQRVALARALVYKPRVLLFDEPLSNLDAKLRERMRIELRKLVSEIGITSVYVTHDQIEAIVMSDRILVMHQGKILQDGTPQAIYDRPANRFVADFIGRSNLVGGKVKAYEARETISVEVPEAGAVLQCVGTEKKEPGQPVVVSIRPEHISVVSGIAPSEGNILTGTVRSAVYLGQNWDLFVQVGEVEFRILSQIDKPVAAGESVRLHISREKCVCLPE
jgi:ABC-type Fe3+/spermidine/putrescine transport system ATPase subunit